MSVETDLGRYCTNMSSQTNRVILKCKSSTQFTCKLKFYAVYFVVNSAQLIPAHDSYI